MNVFLEAPQELLRIGWKLTLPYRHGNKMGPFYHEC